MAGGVKKAGAPVATLFFPKDYKPALGHEYHFDLDSAARKIALQQYVKWLRQLPR